MKLNIIKAYRFLVIPTMYIAIYNVASCHGNSHIHCIMYMYQSSQHPSFKVVHEVSAFHCILTLCRHSVWPLCQWHRGGHTEVQLPTL